MTLMGLNLFGDHASYIMTAMVPVYWVWPEPQALLVVQTLALAVVAARDRLSSHLTHRESVYVFPTPFSANSWGDESQKGQRLPMADEVDYVLEIPRLQSETAADVWAALPAEGFVTIFEEEGVVLLRRARPEGPAFGSPERAEGRPYLQPRLHWIE